MASAFLFTAVAAPMATANPALSASSPRLAAAERSLDARIRQLGRAFDGDIGIAVRDVETGHVAAFDGGTYFPQQSVSKLWVALAALDAAERGKIDLSAPVTLRRSDLTLFHQPIAQQIRKRGSYRSTLDELIRRALQQSDNTCNDFVLHKVGGPDAVRAYLASHDIEGIRFGPGERLMQSRLAGLTWKQSYSIGNAFFEARRKVPLSRRYARFDAYVADPVDGAKPIAVVETLARLKKGELLSKASTEKLLAIMSKTRTGPRRLKGGLARGWRIAHKTGTGQQVRSMQTGYNDIGIVTSPEGRSYAVAVMIRRTSAPVVSRMEVMQDVVRAVVDYDRDRGTLGSFGSNVAARRNR